MTTVTFELLQSGTRQRRLKAAGVFQGMGWGRAHQDQLSIIGQFSGPGGLGALSLQKSLITHHFVFTLPFYQTLKGIRGQMS